MDQQVIQKAKFEVARRRSKEIEKKWNWIDTKPEWAKHEQISESRYKVISQKIEKVIVTKISEELCLGVKG